MGQTISTQHPAVVLRSRYVQLRALLVVAMVAVVALAGTVVILAVDDDGTDFRADSAAQISVPSGAAAIRADGGPEESATASEIGSHESTPATGGPDESVVADAVSPD